jgi:hypothetical protein
MNRSNFSADVLIPSHLPNVSVAYINERATSFAS